MPTYRPSVTTGEFILREPADPGCRVQIVIASGSGRLEAGHVLGKIAATGEYGPYESAADDGRESAVGVLYSRVDATNADAKAVLITRATRVQSGMLTWTEPSDAEAGAEQLAELGMVLS